MDALLPVATFAWSTCAVRVAKGRLCRSDFDEDGKPLSCLSFFDGGRMVALKGSVLAGDATPLRSASSSYRQWILPYE